MRQSQRANAWWQLLIGSVLVLAAGWLILNRQFVQDSFQLMNYQPTDSVRQLADTTQMSSTGRRTFYLGQPQIDGSATFGDRCQQHETGAAVLGCYVSGQIYIYDVRNAELEGIKEVTAAHEMLHAAYDRLSADDKSQVNSWLDVAQKRLSDDAAFRERMKVYQDLSAADRLNEYHSVLATEISDVGPELEQYYSRYFENRSAVVAMHQRYAGVFRELEAEAQQLAASLDAQATSINQRSQTYSREVALLDGQISAFNRRASTEGGFSSRAEFDSVRRTLENQAAALESERSAINMAIDSYNRDKQRYDGVAAHLVQLNQSIDSSLAKPSKVAP